jgi:TonB family protein
VAAAAPPPEPAPKPKAPASAFTSAVAADPKPQPPAKRQLAAEPLEILFKPRPDYTEEARRARLEGDVVLEVQFTSSGSLRVLRVVHGLGHGLDQNAIDAAGKIRFRPATEDGRAVDTVAMVRISFQIAY